MLVLTVFMSRELGLTYVILYTRAKQKGGRPFTLVGLNR